MDPVAEILFNYLRNAIYHPVKAELDLEKLPPGFRDFAKGLTYYIQCVWEVTDMARDLSKGNLHGKSPEPENEVAAPLKSLCAALRHLTWQTQQVARGDYSQQVNFMGEFATSFNVMVEQLALRQKALLGEIDNSNRKMVALAQSKSLFEAIAGQVPQWIIVIDRNEKTWRYANRSAGELLANTNFEIRLRGWLERQTETHDKAVPCTEELELRDGDVEQCFRVAIHPLQWQEQEALAFILTDVSASRARLRKLEGMAYNDPLTKTYNRHFGMERLADWLKKRKDFILCFVDIDNLKYVNDKFGHNEGDAYILTVAEALMQFPNSIVCRLGGDEFMLLATDWNEEMAFARMELLRDTLAERNHEPEHEYRHSISYGLVEVRADNQLESSELLSLADERMYAYKRGHKPVVPPTSSPGMS